MAVVSEESRVGVTRAVVSGESGVGVTRAVVSDWGYLDTSIEFEEAGSVQELTAVELKVIINKALLDLYGEVGCSIQVDVLRCDTESIRFILRTPYRSLVHVWSALTLCGVYKEHTLAFRVHMVSDHLMTLAHLDRKCTR